MCFKRRKHNLCLQLGTCSTKRRSFGYSLGQHSSAATAAAPCPTWNAMHQRSPRAFRVRPLAHLTSFPAAGAAGCQASASIGPAASTALSRVSRRVAAASRQRPRFGDSRAVAHWGPCLLQCGPTTTWSDSSSAGARQQQACPVSSEKGALLTAACKHPEGAGRRSINGRWLPQCPRRQHGNGRYVYRLDRPASAVCRA